MCVRFPILLVVMLLGFGCSQKRENEPKKENEPTAPPSFVPELNAEQRRKQAHDQALLHFMKLGGKPRNDESESGEKMLLIVFPPTQFPEGSLKLARDLMGKIGLHLGSATLSDSDLAQLQGLESLEFLALPWSKITAEALAHVRGFTNLRSLNLNGLPLSDASLENIATLPHLTRLSLNRTQVGDVGMGHLKKVSRLQYLDISGTLVTDAGLAQLSGLTNLQSLQLAGTPVSDAGLNHLKGLTKLESLGLNTTKVTDAGVQMIKSAIPSVGISR